MMCLMMARAPPYRPLSSPTANMRTHTPTTTPFTRTPQEDEDLLLQAAAIPSEDEAGNRHAMPTPASDFAAAAAGVAKGFQGTLRWVDGLIVDWGIHGLLLLLR